MKIVKWDKYDDKKYLGFDDTDEYQKAEEVVIDEIKKNGGLMMEEAMHIKVNGRTYVDVEKFKKELIRLLNQDLEDVDSVDEKKGLEIAQRRILSA